jgi:hypothetical protein
MTEDLDLGDDSVNEDIGTADDIYIAEPIIEEPEPLRLKAKYEPPPDSGSDEKAKAGPPRVDQWQDFFSRVVIRTVTNFYIDAAFRGIDEDLLSDREIEAIRMTEEERDRLARPFAEFANKSKIMRRYGRLVISSGGMVDSFIALGMWVRRVSRISRKYKNRTVQANVSTGQNQPSQNGTAGAGYPNQYYMPGG